MAPGTVSRRMDGSFAIELRRKCPDIPGRRPLHVGDLGDGASVGTWVAMAVEAPAHTEGLHLGDDFHLVDTAVAGDTADSSRHVNAVGEIGVVGELVNPNPVHRPAAGKALPNRGELLTVFLRGRVAVHARLGRRNVRDGGNFDRSVTVPAIKTKLADVEFVAVGNRLNRTVPHVRVPRRKVVPDARDRQCRNEDARNGRHDREVVPPTGEYLSQCD